MKEPRFQIGKRRVLAEENFIPIDKRIKERFEDIPEKEQVRRKAWLWANYAWLEAPLTKGWIVAFRIVIQKGRPVIAELRIFPDENLQDRPVGEWSASMLGNDAKCPRGGVTMHHIRQLRLSILRSEINKVLADYRANAPELLDLVKLESPRKPRRVKKPRGRGRPSLPDKTLAAMAKLYAERCYSGSLSPVQDTA